MNSLAEPKLFSKDLLREIRKRFLYLEEDPISGPRVWLESASGSLRLASAVDRLAEQTRFPDQLGRANPSSRLASEMMARGVEDVRLFLGATSGTIMPAMSSTHAVFRVVNAVLGSARGKNVVTTDLEHPCVYDSTAQFAELYGKEWRIAHLDPESGSVPADSILDRIDRDTALLGLIHGSNMTGAVLDLKTIVTQARKINPEMYILVDGVQYAPHAPVDVNDLDVDAYVFGPYKAFSVKGIGFAYLSERLSRLKHWGLLGNPPNSWVLGSPEEATYGAWSAVVDYLCWLGGHFTTSTDRRCQLVAAMQASQAHLEALRQQVLRGTDELPGLWRMKHVVTHGLEGQMVNRLCLVLFSLKGIDSQTGVELYNRERVRLHNRIKDAYSRHSLQALGLEEGIRLSACHYNSPEDIDRFLRVTARIGEMASIELDAVRSSFQEGGRGEG